MDLALRLIGCGAAAAFFALLFRAPARLIAPSSLLAAAGWALSAWAGARLHAEWVGAFLGSALVALVAEWLARRLRAPATIFLTVAIIPLVPGAGLYNTMLALVQSRPADAAAVGAQTMMAAGGIALGLSIAASLPYALRRRTR
ncbi:MAG: threonine/serine exporter [Clostridiales bacterium]|nr:threonine/serine exporter [Clostridiales bacterium]